MKSDFGLIVLSPEQCTTAKPDDHYFTPNDSDLPNISEWLKSLPQGAYLLSRGRYVNISKITADSTPSPGFSSKFSEWEYGYAILIGDGKIMFVWDGFRVEICTIDGVNLLDLVHFVKITGSTAFSCFSTFRVNKIINPFSNYEINTQVGRNQLTVFIHSKNNNLYGKLVLICTENELELNWGGVWNFNTNKKVKFLTKSGRKKNFINIEILLNRQKFVLAINKTETIEQSMSDFLIKPTPGSHNVANENLNTDTGTPELDVPVTLEQKITPELTILQDGEVFMRKVIATIQSFNKGTLYFPFIPFSTINHLDSHQ